MGDEVYTFQTLLSVMVMRKMVPVKAAAGRRFERSSDHSKSTLPLVASTCTCATYDCPTVYNNGVMVPV